MISDLKCQIDIRAQQVKAEFSALIESLYRPRTKLYTPLMDNKNVTRELPFEGIWQITDPIKNDVRNFAQM